MGNTVTVSDTLIIALGCMVVILAVLVTYALSLVVKISKIVMEGNSGKTEQNQVQNISNGNFVQQMPAQSIDDSDDEEDRLVAALAASAFAADDKPDSHFRITRITRIK